ncbi:uncharacterized protein [Drosophila kikkawai]|uniref:MD-2-related lipid-recognition domain-containing protein n=1 Tax=Drosophila kikkawai TaxID=30033 RepID=A0A6P4IRA0_DROKI|nr:uncharacterized protein LOC108076852 [Drosophila kikkawai]
MSLEKPYKARFESLKSSGSITYFRARLLGRDHRLNGTLIFKEDMGNNFVVSVESYNDATGSGNYKQTLYSASKIPFCQFIDTYWKYFAPSMEFGKNTDVPFINHTCPIPKGEYYVKDVIIKTDGWPYVMPRGFFKAVCTVQRDDEIVSSTELIVSFTDRTGN